MFVATGDYPTGGIASCIVEVLQGGAYNAAFEDKPSFRKVMQDIRRFVLVRPEPAIDGLAALLHADDRYLFPGQDWRA